MTRKTTMVLALWAMLTSTSLVAQKDTEQAMEKEANALFTSGEFLKAYPLFSQLVSLNPGNADYGYKFGACAIYSDPDKTKAIKYLVGATKKSVADPMVWYYLGKAYHLNYQFKEAVTSYEKFMATADAKVSSKTDAQRNIETCIYGSNLLSNVKDVTVISKTESDKQNFFRYMNLDGIGGKIVTVPEELKSNLDKKSKSPGVIHYPGNSTTIYFSSLGKDGSHGRDIYSAQMTADGKYTNVQQVKGDVNSKYDEDFCFMHSDGKTLYFSSKGHNSMGGFDIFKSELDPNTGTFGKAINLDFAINTPDDDIFYIADSLNQRAYFASGRSSDLDHLHVYNVMVTSQPMQVVYLKGLYANTIDSEELKATFQIVDNTSNKITSDGTTNSSSGDYLGYVEHSGLYTMKVKTANSPTIHEVSLNIPKFDKPVALRQEMKLITEGGQEKLIVTNFFETPLETDLSDLASEMLRRKAKLDVNATPAANEAPKQDVSANLGNKDIEQVALAAGFSDAETPQVVADQMKQSADNWKAESAKSTQRSQYAQMYAAQKHKEAEAELKSAEMLRESTSGYNSEEDIAKIKESLEKTSKATALQREAEAALTAADLEDKQAIASNERATKIEEQERILRQSLTTSDYDSALKLLTDEKQRRKTESASVTQEIETGLTISITDKTTELAAAESKLVDMRNQENKLKDELKGAQSAMESAKKEKDKQATEFAYINKKGELDALRKNIKNQLITIKGIGSDLAEAKTDKVFYQQLASNPSLGIKESPEALMETERLALGMKLKGMDNRLASLEITDPSTLAMLGEMETASSTSTETTAATSDTKSTPITTDETVQLPEATVASSATASADLPNKETNTVGSIETTLSLVQSTPALAPAKHMVLTQAIAETDEKIATYEKLKRENKLTVAQNNELTALNTQRNDLQMQLASSPSPTVKLTDEEAREVYAQVAPNYNERITQITNGPGTSADQAMVMIAYRKELHLSLAQARMKQAKSIQSSTDAKLVTELAAKDAKMESAQQKLMSEPSELALIQGAYELDNKAIIESDAVYNEKLQDQISITENYATNLSSLINTKQTAVEYELDQAKAIQMRTEIGMLKQELDRTNNKLESYLKDLQLTASASNGLAETTAVKPAGEKTKKDESPISASAAEKNLSKIAVEDDTKKVESILKPRVEQESIFAYESSLFEELLAKYETPNNKLNNRDKIQKINDEIFLIEAEMENESNETKLKKLDYRAEQMYLQRAEAEVDNAPVIAAITLQAFSEENKKANEGRDNKESEIENSDLVNAEINMLMTSAQNYMAEAEEIRKAAPQKDDAIEKADMYRNAFAKEALAIQQLKQVQDITENIDVFANYSEAEIASMRSGRVPSQETTLAAVSVTGSPDQTDTAIAAETTSSNTESESSANQLKSTSTSEVSSNDEPLATTASKDRSSEEQLATNTTSPATAPSKATDNGSIEVKSDKVKGADLITNNAVALKSSEKASASAPAGDSGTNATNAVPTSSNETTSNPSVAANASKTSEKPSTTITPASTRGTENNFPVAPRTSSPAPKAPESAESADASYSAENYLFSAPSVLKGDLFMRTSRPVYSENKPIPVDMTMPQGVYYKVQVGAFRNDIPQNLYDQFAPVCGEKINNGITRYTAGFFVTLSNANSVKQSIRSLGYKDAFVVAYLNGKRIPIYEALAMTNGDSSPVATTSPNTSSAAKKTDTFQEAIEKEYVKGDAGTAKSTPVSQPSESNATASLPGKLNPNYYIADATVVQADQVEKIEGLFYTIQVGVYSKPVNSSLLGYITPLNTELLKDSKLRYTSGRYTNLKDAAYKRDQAKSLGIADAFITAYYNGVRITISEADRLLSEKGESILAR